MRFIQRAIETRSVAVFISCGCLLACSGLDSSADPNAVAREDSGSRSVHWPRVESGVRQDPPIEARIDALLRRMKLEHKIGQMVQPDIRNVTAEQARIFRLGSILNGGGSFPNNRKHSPLSDWVALADRYYDASMDTSTGAPAIPILWGTDAVHGHNNVVGATLFPHNIGLGAARDPDLIERIGEITALEVAASGIDWTFAPTVAVARDDRWGRTYESYSEDPEIVSAYAGRMVRGLQGAVNRSTFLDPARILATAKHFIGDGGTKNGVDRGDTQVPEQELLDVHAQGYLAALSAGVQTIMVSYSSWQGLKMHGNQYLLTDVLRTKLGFDGLLVSDWDGVDEVQGCSRDKCAQAINAGIDLIMVPQEWQSFIANTLASVRSGEISETRIDEAVRRILRVKFRAGLFDKGRPSSRALANRKELIGAPEHRAVARRAVRESLVLLKNDNALLPLRRNLRVLVAGAGADDIARQAGGWSVTWQGTDNSNADFPRATSIFAGIAAAVHESGGTAVLSKDGSFSSRPDVAIVVFGEDPYAEWFGNIRSLDYQGPDGNDERLLRKLKQSGIPVVAVFLTGRPLWIEPELDAADAFVVAWLPGSEGAGVADVLLRNDAGAVNYDFTGKLPFSWPRAADQFSVNRHDSDYAPRFPYGFGLTYGDQDAE